MASNSTYKNLKFFDLKKLDTVIPLEELKPMVQGLKEKWQRIDESDIEFPKCSDQPMVFDISLKEMKDLINYASDPTKKDDAKIEKIAGILCLNEGHISIALLGINSKYKPVFTTVSEKWPTLKKINNKASDYNIEDAEEVIDLFLNK